jgi:two-component system chemotaxis sensor kinase CheA
MDIRARLFAAFQIECPEHVETIRARMKLISERKEGSGISDLDEIFRRAHSLKGAARAVDLPALEQIAHRMETLFAKMREGVLLLDGDLQAVISRSLDAIEDWMAAYSENRTEIDISQAVSDLDAVLEKLAAPAEDDAPPEETPAPTSPPKPTRKSPPTTTPESAPAKEEPPAHAMVKAEETLRVRASHLDRLLRTANEILTESLNQRQVTTEMTDIDRRLADIARQLEHFRRLVYGLGKGRSSPEDAIRIAREFEGVEQQFRQVRRHGKSARRLQQRTGWALRQLGTELQRELRQARMIPADNVFGGFRKMVRDIAKDHGKQVEVTVSGLDVEADRIVLQAFKDPVMHLLRNSVSHGVEKPEIRKSKGRPTAGHISLGFEIAGGRLAISVEDDGAGIDLERLRQKAIEQRLISTEAAQDISEEELIDFIFDPGFSTAEAVSDLSGRGMGMSVVRETARRLNGAVEVRRLNPGALFRISVPLSVSSQRLFMVTCKGQRYCIPTDGVDRVARLKEDEVSSIEGRPTIRLGERHMPLFSLARLLDLGETAVSVAGGVLPIVVLKGGDRRIAVAVDDFLAIRDGMIKDIGLPIARGSKISGGIILEDGTVSLVLNPFEIVESLRKFTKESEFSTVARDPEAERRVPSILVVDDSLTTRTLEKSLLEAHGYNVSVAVDGLEALNRLRSERVDLVISDIEMPRLDGFGLLSALKNDPGLKTIPVILVSSLEKPEHQEKGLALGADAYVVKRKFDQKELLETIEQII